jgi:exopolysaccharide production protein ExoQ
MHPSWASLLTVVFILYLFIRDFRQQSETSHALWIPWLWMTLVGSRYVSQWLNPVPGIDTTADSYLEGSPIDRAIFFLLITSSLYVLWKRQISWSQVFQNNTWPILYLSYCGVSILWSDFPFTAFKKWIKILGHPLMVLLLLTEPEPLKAIETVMKRCAYVLFPISILYIKYYPHLGRMFDKWTGAPMNNGVTTGKNALGYISMIFGLFFTCKLLSLFGKNREPGKLMEKVITITFLLMSWWLLQLSQSSTSFMCFVISVFMASILGISNIKRNILLYMVISILALLILQMVFNITEVTILQLGRDMTLTDRTRVWEAVLKMKTDPLFGTGFESFWLGERLERLWKEFWWEPNQAHNGYIETYINLGWLGVFFLSGAIFASFIKIQRMLKLPLELGISATTDFDFGRFRMGLLVVLIIYNITEATFKALHILFLMFFIIVIEYPQLQSGVYPFIRSRTNTTTRVHSNRLRYAKRLSSNNAWQKSRFVR